MRKIFSFTLTCLFAVNTFSQNVGVGTPTPAEKLHVVGNIKADTLKPTAIKIASNAGSGKILTSDESGNGSWQSSSIPSGNIGYGVWGDCATNGNVSEYFPVADTAGAAVDAFGYSVSISGNYAIVGVISDDVGANIDQGSACIYQWNGSSWVFMQKLTDPTGAATDNFGTSVSISGNYAIVGAPLDDIAGNADQGSASIYQWNGSSWALMQKITDVTGAAVDVFGNTVSISGNYAIVGAGGDDIGANANQGSVSIYQWNGSNWVLMQKITDATGAAGDLFGIAVSISGNYIIVGASNDAVGTNMVQGSASIYQWNGSSWVLMQKITDADGAANDFFGRSVSISGNYVIVGSSSDDIGANFDQGSASIYQWNGSTWVFMQKITDPNGVAQDGFGNSVSISGKYAIVGCYTDDIGANTTQGSASIYQRVGLGWGLLQYVKDPMGAMNDSFGYSVSVDDTTKRFLIGAYGYGNVSGKSLFGKIN